MEFYSYLRHIQDLLFDGKTPYERRFGMPFNGPVIPFGALLENHPTSANDQSRLHQLGATVLSGFFPGYALYVSENLWSRTLKNWRRWTHRDSTPEGSMQRKCSRRTEVENFMFPVSRWKSQNLWARIASENIHFDPLSSGTRRRTRNSSRKVR